MNLLAKIAAVITPERIAAINNWRRQPTTVHGAAVISAAAAAYAAQQVTLAQFFLLAFGGLIACVLPDNSDRKTSTVPAAVVAATPKETP